MICNKYEIRAEGKQLIGFAGPPSSGKDIMADALSSALTNISGKVPEEARKYIQENGKLYNIFQQDIIYHRQREHEEEIQRNYQIAISSSPLFLAYFYTVLLKSDTPTGAEYSIIADMYKKAVISLDKYDYLFLCEPLELYTQDSVRYQSNNQVEILNTSIKSFLDLHNKDYCLLPALPVDDRLEICANYIGAHQTGK